MRTAEPLPVPALTPQEASRLKTVVMRPEVQTLLDLLNDQQARTMIVGGAIRNALLDRPVVDIDLATTLTPKDVMARAHQAKIKTVATGLEHGTLTLVSHGHAFEVTTLRKDVETDGRRATIAYSPSFIEDANRRDFTMNALYADQNAALYDPVSGLKDLRKGQLRFIGGAKTRIREDYLRILRFFRFYADYGDGTIDIDGLAACIALKDGLTTLSRERIGHEWIKLLMTRKACETITLMHNNGFLPFVLPADITVQRLVDLLTLAPASAAMPRLFALLWPNEAMIADCQTALRLSNAQTKHLSDLRKALQTLPDPSTETVDHRHPLQLWAFKQGARIAQQALGLYAASTRQDHSTLTYLSGLIANLPERSPFSGTDFLELGCKAGPSLGAMLQKLEALWIEEGFPSDLETQKALVRRVVNQEHH